jgi:hypothetical protein
MYASCDLDPTYVPCLQAAGICGRILHWTAQGPAPAAAVVVVALEEEAEAAERVDGTARVRPAVVSVLLLCSCSCSWLRVLLPLICILWFRPG